MIKLSILICTIPQRRETFLHPLLREIRRQITENNLHGQVEIIFTQDTMRYDTIGRKRNWLLDVADGDYVAHVDDDDRIGPNYLRLVMEGIERGVDCCSLVGEITEDGNNPLIFEHSIKYKEYRTNPDPTTRVRYERFPNHLNTIKSSIAKKFRFPEKNHGEDTDFATKIFNSGIIKTEHEIQETIYLYDYRSKKPELK